MLIGVTETSLFSRSDIPPGGSVAPVAFWGFGWVGSD